MTTAVPDWQQRLQFLARVADRTSAYLQTTDERLFAHPMTLQRVAALVNDVADAEQVDAFVSRFGRLQDTLGGKLLPRYLEAVGEPAGALLDNLDRAERMGLVASADAWMAVRRLRNQMVHEYIEQPDILQNALHAGHRFVPTLLATHGSLRQALAQRHWI